MKSLALIVMLLAAAGLSAQPQRPADIDLDPLLTAMLAELERAQQLRLVSSDDVYFVQYTVDESSEFSVRATLGAVISESRTTARFPRIDVRVGSYEFDNTNYVFSDLFTGRNRISAGLPIDNNVTALRSYFWLASDVAYKGALSAIARKRAALKNVNVREEIPDFTKTEPLVLVRPREAEPIDADTWKDDVRKLSAVFNHYSQITSSQVRFTALQGTAYQVNTEGTITRYPEHLYFLEVRASAQAEDGMVLHNADVVERLSIGGMPPAQELQSAVTKVADDLQSLLKAPVGDTYVGPVLFSGEASPQLFSQLLGNHLALSRRPVPEPGRPVPFQASDLEGRFGARILPEWMSVVDDPTQEEWRGRPLLGHYEVDIEGVKPEPLRLVNDGVLEAFLLTRQPVEGFAQTNGRARLPGQFGANTAFFGNLFVRASETTTEDGLKDKLLEMVAQQNKEYGLVIRQLDYPSSASVGEIRRLANGSQGPHSLVSNPILAYRVYPDGREELVRGLQFQGLTVRVLRDILAASDQMHQFDHLRNNAPLSMMGAGGFMTAASVIAPSVLIEDMELDLPDQEQPTTPVVPPPALDAGE